MKVALGIIMAADNAAVLIAKRPEGKPFAGYWEFPGGKYEQGESPEAALIRELEEEVNITPLEYRYLMPVVYERQNKQIELHAWIVTAFSGQPRGNEAQEIRWQPVNALIDLTFPPYNEAIIQAVLNLVTS